MMEGEHDWYRSLREKSWLETLRGETHKRGKRERESLTWLLRVSRARAAAQRGAQGGRERLRRAPGALGLGRGGGGGGGGRERRGEAQQQEEEQEARRVTVHR